jgi:hypothetical protein
MEAYKLELVNIFIQKTEADIMVANDWNLNSGTGSDILQLILKMSNHTYDFSKIFNKVKGDALRAIFQIDEEFSFSQPR